MRSALCCALLSAFACATPPPPRPAHLDPSRPDAPEAPLPAPSTALDAEAAAPSPAPATVYTCPMHPEVQQPTKGRCPKCGMELAP